MSAPAAATPGRRGGRDARRAARTDAISHVPDLLRPGIETGTYRPLTDAQMDRIIATARRVLADYGMADATPGMAALLLANGAERQAGRIAIPSAMVDAALASACRSFEVFGIDGTRKITLGGTRVNFGTNSYTPSVRDIETGEYRDPTVTDLYDLTRLIDALDNFHYVRIPVIARDLDGDAFDLNSAYAVASGTGKPFCLTISFARYVDDVAELFDMIAGGPGRFAERPFCLPICVHVVPPMKFASESCRVIERLVALGWPVILYSADMIGATSPASVAGMLVQTVAEVFAGLVWVNLMRPGHPMLAGISPLGCDIRTGACVMGSAEHALLEAASAQLCRYLDLPGAQLSGATDSKREDYQAAAERTLGALTVGLAGANHVGIAGGGFAANMGMAAEALVMDNDNLGNVLRVMKGVDTSDEMLAYETIGETIAGEGHYLGHAATMRLITTEFYYPEFIDREAIGDWEEKGRRDPFHQARERAEMLLATHFPDHIPEHVDAAIRARFDISLPRAAMSPGARRPLTAQTPECRGTSQQEME